MHCVRRETPVLPGDFLALAVVIGSPSPRLNIKVSSDGDRNLSGGRSKSRTNYTRCKKFRVTATLGLWVSQKERGTGVKYLTRSIPSLPIF
jgi:hypothetical protein